MRPHPSLLAARWVCVVGALLATAGCDDDDPTGPDGEEPQGTIVFMSLRSGDSEGFLLELEGPTETPLVNTEQGDDEFTCKRDGTQLAFASQRDGDVEVYKMNLDGSGATRLTNRPGYDGYPQWSPDGSRIAFATDRDGDIEVYVMNADGSNQTRVTNSAAGDDYPSGWSADATRLVIESDRDGDYDLYSVLLSSGAATPLTTNDVQDWYANISRDGTRIAFDRGRDPPSYFGSNTEVWVMNFDGSGATRVTNNTFFDGRAVWAPDLSRLVFQSERDGNMELYSMNADGSDQQRLTTNTAFDRPEAWCAEP